MHQREYHLSHRAYHLMNNGVYRNTFRKKTLAEVELAARERHRVKFQLIHDEGHRIYEEIYLKPFIENQFNCW